MTAWCTIPTLRVLVIISGVSIMPRSSTQVVPVISPSPLSENHAANTGAGSSLPRGQIAVTPVRTGPSPTTSGPLPRMMVACPTVTPDTSVMAFNGPGVPSNGTPRSRALGLSASWAAACPAIATSATVATIKVMCLMGSPPVCSRPAHRVHPRARWGWRPSTPAEPVVPRPRSRPGSRQQTSQSAEPLWCGQVTSFRASSG